MNAAIRFPWLWVAPLSLSAAAVVATDQVAAPTPDARIDFYSKKLAADPKLYPVYVQLGAAYFDKAKETHDPLWLPKAYEAFQESNKIQLNLPAYQALSALCNYRHRFPEAIEWGRKVLETEPDNSAVVAGMVEAHLASGRTDDARELLAKRGDGAGDFHLAAAHGAFLKATGQPAETAAAFTRAADAAKKANAKGLAAWALVQVAGVWIDAGDHERAVPLLERAAELDPDHPDLAIHKAEVLEARGQLNEAIGLYETLLARTDDPFVHAAAATLARRHGDAPRAQRHFEAAERGMKRPIEAGEVYTLGALAKLYLEADTRLSEALELAQRNARHQKDAASRELVEQLERRLAAPATP